MEAQGLLSDRSRAFCELDVAGLGKAPELGFQWLILERYGRRPIAARGCLMLRVDNRCVGLNGWSEIRIYDLRESRIAVTLSHRLSARLVPAWRDSWVCADAGAARATLCAHDPACTFLPSFQTAGFLRAWQGLVLALTGTNPHVRAAT
jgi:hypothetical protein